MLPGEAIRGTSTFEWLDGQRFVIWRSHYDHPQIPDAITIIGVTDGQLSMHYFDQRGVYRVYAASLDQAEWRYWRDAAAPDFSQRFTGTFSDDGNTITGRGQLSQDGSTWEDDLALNYQRVAERDVTFASVAVARQLRERLTDAPGLRRIARA